MYMYMYIYMYVYIYIYIYICIYMLVAPAVMTSLALQEVMSGRSFQVAVWQPAFGIRRVTRVRVIIRVARI